MFNPLRYFLSLSLATFLLLSGCANTSTLYSNTFVKPATRIKKLNIVYIESRLASRGSKSSDEFYDLGYTDLPELLRERIQLVFGMNGIETEYATFKSRDFGQPEVLQSIDWANSSPDSMLLTLQIIDGRVVTGSHTPRTTTLNLQANLINPRTKLRQWTGQFRNTFVAPPAGKNGFDNAFVDKMLKNILEQMAKDEIILLATDQALMPTSQPVRSTN